MYAILAVGVKQGPLLTPKERTYSEAMEIVRFMRGGGGTDCWHPSFVQTQVGVGDDDVEMYVKFI